MVRSLIPQKPYGSVSGHLIEVRLQGPGRIQGRPLLPQGQEYVLDQVVRRHFVFDDAAYVPEERLSQRVEQRTECLAIRCFDALSIFFVGKGLTHVAQEKSQGGYRPGKRTAYF